jgi:hypothetical protein
MENSTGRPAGLLLYRLFSVWDGTILNRPHLPRDERLVVRVVGADVDRPQMGVQAGVPDRLQVRRPDLRQAG